MNLTLTRTRHEADGIFGELRSMTDLIAYTLEHAYDDGSGRGSFAPKVPEGIYICRRSMHRLAHMTKDFETFQIMDVPDHDNILFHWGNFNKDSEGCVLLGEALASYQGGHMITNSKAEFARFMELQAGVETFSLTILG